MSTALGAASVPRFYSTESPSEIALHQINFADDDHIAHHTHHNYIIDRSTTLPGGAPGCHQAILSMTEPSYSADQCCHMAQATAWRSTT